MTTKTTTMLKSRFFPVMRRIASGAVAATVGASVLVALAATPASAHYSSIIVGQAKGEMGPGHNAVRICELGAGRGAIEVAVVGGFVDRIVANNRCENVLLRGPYFTAYRVGYAEGDEYIWSSWRAA